MTDAEFWSHIAALNATGANPNKHEPYRKKLVAHLQPLGAEIIAGFMHLTSFHMMQLRTRPLWCAATLACGGACGDEKFTDFRAWIVAQGAEAFARVLANPDHVAELDIPSDKSGTPVPLLKPLTGTPGKLFLKKIGDDVERYRSIWKTLRADASTQHEEDFHIGWSYWDARTAEELQRDFPALWAKFGEQYLVRAKALAARAADRDEFDDDDDDDDDDMSRFVREAELPGLGTVRIGDTLIHRHDGGSFTVLGINDSSVGFGGESIGGDDFRYSARVRDSEGEISSGQGLSGRYQRRPGDPDTGPTVIDDAEGDEDDADGGVSDASMALDDAIQARVKAALGDDVHVIYEAYDFTDDDLPVDNLDKRAHKGKIRFVAEDPNDGERYESAVLVDPTWLDVTRAANDMLLALGDRHHVYLEGFDIVKKPKGEPVIAEFSMGS